MFAQGYRPDSYSLLRTTVADGLVEDDPAEDDALEQENSESAVPIWIPLPGPQTDAYYSPADEIFYGGSAGGGKTDLLLGLAGTTHHRSLILRRLFPSMRNIIERSREVYNPAGLAHSGDSYNESLHIWRLSSGRMIEFGSIQRDEAKEKYRGRPHDFYGWDEITEFSEGVYRFVNGWNRTTRRGQRCRIVCTGNPPMTAAGRWVIKYWGPWLDPDYQGVKALPGELRWFANIDGIDVELEAGAPFEHTSKGKVEVVYPRSRTFIPARLSDNPYLDNDPAYRAVLQGMPEPIRSQMLYGDFGAGTEDDPWQVIPTEWVEAAFQRWDESPEAWKQAGRPILADGRAMPLTRLGNDVARGGKDWTVLARLYGNWFGRLERYPGSATPDGPGVATLVVAALLEGGHANIDGIGVGTSVYDSAVREMPGRVHSVIFSAGARNDKGDELKDKTGTLGFANVRAYCYWSFREALAPGSGFAIALPRDEQLKADLCTPKYEVRGGRIYVEDKEAISERLGGRSTDDGDAVVLAWYEKPVKQKRHGKILGVSG